MNSNRSSSEGENHNQPDQKVKLNRFSKSIFNIIFSFKEVTDTELMKHLINEFSSVKEETLKRRKYDTVNILEKANIIIIRKLNDSFMYLMKHDVPNSVKDLEAIKARTEIIQNRIQQKQQKLRMIRLAKANYERLVLLNKNRKQNKNPISLPIVVLTEPFTESTLVECHNLSMIKLRFPSGTKYIGNVMSQAQLFYEVQQL